MTEKRYSKMMNHYGTSRTYCTGIYDNQNNRELQNSNQVITELNALNDENKQLQKDCTALIYNNQEYRKENEQLKQRIKVLEDTIDGLTGTIAHFDLDEVIGND